MKIRANQEKKTCRFDNTSQTDQTPSQSEERVGNQDSIGQSEYRTISKITVQPNRTREPGSSNSLCQSEGSIHASQQNVNKNQILTLNNPSEEKVK